MSATKSENGNQAVCSDDEIKEPLPVLYSFRRCPYAMRARLVLLAVGQPVILREVLLRNKPLALLELSAKATVPVMQLPDGTVLDESMDIIHWALTTRHGTPRLDMNLPAGKFPAEQAQLIERNDGEFKHWLDRYKYHVRYPEYSEQYVKDQAGSFVASLEDRLGHAKYLFGDQPTIADLAIMPFVRQFSMVDSRCFEHSPHQKVRQWLGGWLEHPVFSAAMQKTVVWQESVGEQSVLQINH